MPTIIRNFSSTRPAITYLLGMFAASILTLVVYWNGLPGGFVFDDYPNIVDNEDVHLTSLDIAQLKAAALSAPPGAGQRPIASLTFALNWWIDPGSASAMKSVNLLIHVADGLLLYAMLVALLGAAAAAEKRGDIDRTLPLAVAACWMLAPINLTCVLYVVQRMESLCQLFVLAGLWGYFAGRRLALSDQRQRVRGLVMSSASLVIGGILGVLTKESAALLPLYAFVAEMIVLRFRAFDGSRDRRLFPLFVITLIVPGVVGSWWLIPHVLTPAAWANRDFSVEQRLLTETRVVLDYLVWTLVPLPRFFNLYHDDFVVSTGLLTPLSTAIAITAIAVLLIVGAKSSRRLPLVSLGIVWFISAHLLTATIVPLEIAYEHRNYFASIGAFLTLSAALLLIARNAGSIRAGRFALIAMAVFSGIVTFNRAREWADPTQLAIGEAERNPRSVRANYQAGKLFVSMSNYQPSRLLDVGSAYCDRAAMLPGASILPEQALIIVANRAFQRDDPSIWRRLIEKLRAHAPSEENISALAALSDCFTQGQCAFGAESLDEAFTEAIRHQPVRADLATVYQNYAHAKNAAP
jgi:hypothetical protein